MKIDNKCYQYCLQRLNRRAYTVFEMKKILMEKDYNHDEIQKAIQRCEEYNYLNDEKYTDSFIHDKQMIQRWGKLKIIKELNRRGITIISDDLFDQDQEKINIEKHLQTKLEKLSNMAFDVYKKKQQIYRHLYFKGFDQELISKTLAKVDLSTN